MEEFLLTTAKQLPALALFVFYAVWNSSSTQRAVQTIADTCHSAHAADVERVEKVVDRCLDTIAENTRASGEVVEYLKALNGKR